MSHLRASRGLRILLAILSIVALVAACGAATSLNTVGGPVRGEAEGPAAQPGSDQSGAGNGLVPGPNQANGKVQFDVSRPDLLVIKTGNLSLQVTALDDSVATASSKIAALGGYVSGSDRKGDGNDQIATVTYRIPAAQWDAALAAVRGLAEKVLAEQTQTQDVTGDVLDLGARITNLQATEAALQAIMVKATKITDVLAVQQQLTDVRGQIEQLSTEKKHLEGQAAYSTLTVSFGLKPLAAVLTSQQQFDPNSEIDKAAASLVAVLQAIATAGIWFAIVWLPILLVLGVIAAIAFLVIRRTRRGGGGPEPTLPVPTEG